MKSVRVVAAVIRRDGRTLISLRHPGGPRGGKWEFPGGKVEVGESEQDALVREIREELGCEVQVGALIARHRHAYPDLTVELAFYSCELPADVVPKPLDMARLEWADPGSLTQYDFCEADLPVLPTLDQPR
jgi:8-oxo-dGTP diphosphatase